MNERDLKGHRLPRVGASPGGSKRKPGRPPLAASERLSVPLVVDLTSANYELLKETAAAAGKPLAVWARGILLNATTATTRRKRIVTSS